MSKRGTATKARSYTGILNEPMRLPRKTLLDPTLEKQSAQIFVARLHRVSAVIQARMEGREAGGAEVVGLPGAWRA